MKKVYLIFLLFYTTLIYGQSGTSEFTSTGTFTVPDGVTTILVEMIVDIPAVIYRLRPELQ